MANYAIGDIQGCYSALIRLLERIQFNPSHDKLWLLGDIVNRGEDSLATLRFCFEHKQSIFSVLGNHDLHLLACYYGAATVKPGDTLTPILEAPDKKKLINWLLYQPLARYLPQFNCFMSHAGLYPSWTIQQAMRYAKEPTLILQSNEKNIAHFFKHMYGNEPRAWCESLPSLDKNRFIINALTRMRFLAQDGTLEFEEKSDPGSTTKGGLTPWYSRTPRPLINNKQKQTENPIILFGHWAALRGNCPIEGIYALDTGCVWGESLTALRLEDLQIISVPASI